MEQAMREIIPEDLRGSEFTALPTERKLELLASALAGQMHRVRELANQVDLLMNHEHGERGLLVPLKPRWCP